MKYIIVLILSLNVFAHDDHLWSTDTKAYEYTKEKLGQKQISPKHFLKGSTLIDIDESFFMQKLKSFTSYERGSSQGIDQAISFLTSEYESIGYQVQINEFGSIFTKGKNFIATKKGKDSSKVILITSHIDSVGNAGANDNGTGTIGTLAIAKALADYNLNYDLRIVGFDKEEKGLVGSKAYVKALSKDERSKIIGVINFEMMGTNSRKDGKFHIIDCDRSESTFITKAMEGIINWHKIGLTKVPGCTSRSDHASFWKAKIPAIVISENFFGGDSDTCYHKKCDIFDSRLDFKYMENIITAVASTVFEMQKTL